MQQPASRLYKDIAYRITIVCVVKKVRQVASPGLKIKRLCDDDRNVGMKSRNVLPIRGMVGKMID